MRLLFGSAIGACCLVAITSAPVAQAQSVTPPGQSGKVADLISGLYGGNGITLDPAIVFHTAHFAADSQAQLNNLANVIAANIGSASFNSTVSSISFDVEEGVPVRSQESLGPLIAERASTIGKGRFNFGISYTRLDYRQLNGQKLNNLYLVLEHDKATGAAYENDEIALNLDLRLKQDTVAFLASYGLTSKIDVGFVLPLVKIDGSVRSVATVIDRGGKGIHNFGGVISPVSANSASATGVGDIIVRAKWHALNSTTSNLNGALIAQGTIASGDSRDLLGTGSNAFYLGGVLTDTFGKISPHLNGGYEHFFKQANTTGIAVDRSNFRAAAGFDVKARDNLSIATDVLGRWRGDGTHLYDVAIGAKWAPLGDVPISANLVIPLNRNVGLRPDYFFTLGIESTF